MSFTKKILATAIAGGLIATAAHAQVNLSATPTVTPTRLAAESTFPAILNDGTAAFDIVVAARYNFSTNEIRHGRLECSNFRFEDAIIAVTGAGATTTVGPVNGRASNAIFFTMTSGALNADRIVATSTLTFDITGGSSVRANAPVDCTFGIYDTASQAAAGGSSGLISVSASSGRFIEVAQSFGYSRATQTAVATVNFTPIFNFITSGSVAQPGFVIGTRTARIGLFQFDTAFTIGGGVQPLLPSGTASTLATLLGTNSAHVIEGDFSNAANADGTFTGDALARVFLDSDNNCDRTNGTVTNATSLTATSATFVTGAAAVVANTGVCYTSRAGEIPESAYSIRLAPQAFGSTVSPTPVSASLGSIARDGTTLVAPLVQIPAGWISRIALTNTSSVPRPYTISVLGETGNTIATNATALTGFIPARGQIVVDLPSVFSGFTGAPRAHLTVAIAAPRASINGVYQIVNPASGSISNHVMVAAGTN